MKNIIALIILIYLGLYFSKKDFFETKDSSLVELSSCPRPSFEEIERHFNDAAGSKPIDPDFDSEPNEICGNGKTFFCASRGRGKQVPSGWISPPKLKSDKNYKGPRPEEDFKESPYAMAASKKNLERPQIVDRNEADLLKFLKITLKKTDSIIGISGREKIKDDLGLEGKNFKFLNHEIFKTKNSEILARELLSQGISYIIYDRTIDPVAPWIEEEYDSIHLRLRDALDTDWFDAEVIGSTYVLYKINKPLKITKIEKEQITDFTRKLMEGVSPKGLSVFKNPSEFGEDFFRVIVSLRWRDKEGLKGRKFVKRISKGRSLEDAIRKSVKKIDDEWDKISLNVIKDKNLMVTDIPDSLKDAVNMMEIELDVIHKTALISDRLVKQIAWNYELGLHGIIAWYKKKMHYLEPAYAVHMEMKSEVQFIEQMLKKNKLNKFLRNPKKTSNLWRKKVLSEKNWEKNKKLRVGRFRTIHWIETPKDETSKRDIVELYRGVPIVNQNAVNKENLINSLIKGAEWLVTNQTDDGQYAYKYSPVNKLDRRWEPGGNIVRHALNPYTLLMVYKETKDKRYLESAKKGIDYTLKFLRKEGDRCVVCHRDTPAPYYNAKMGTVAVSILSILKLAEVEDISEYLDTLKCFGEQLLFMQEQNGYYRLYDVPKDHPYYGASNTIAPGEIIFALSKLYSFFKDEKYKASIDLALPWYMEAWRHLRTKKTSSGIYNEEDRTNLIGIVPWLVTAMNDLYLSTEDIKYAEIAFEQQEWIDKEFFYYPNRAKYPDYVGASFKMHYELPAINSCQYAEGAAAAYNIALKVNKLSANKVDIERMRQVVLQSMRFCLQLQFTDYSNTFFIPVPEEVMGGYRYTIGHLRLRNDYSYHAMAAIAQALEYLREEDY